MECDECLNVWEKITSCGVDIDFFVVVNVFFFMLLIFKVFFLGKGGGGYFRRMYDVVNQKIKGLGFYSLEVLFEIPVVKLED